MGVTFGLVMAMNESMCLLITTNRENKGLPYPLKIGREMPTETQS